MLISFYHGKLAHFKLTKPKRKILHLIYNGNDVDVAIAHWKNIDTNDIF